MSSYVLDCSITMSWCFRNEASDESGRLLKELEHGEAVVPMLWQYEVANVLITAERANRIKHNEARHFLELLTRLPIKMEPSATSIAELAGLSRETGLTAYDCAYIELALRLGLPLATFDLNLKKAARRLGVRFA